MWSQKRNINLIVYGVIILVLAIVVFQMIKTNDSQTHYVSSNFDIAVGGSVERSVEHADYILYGQYKEHLQEHDMGGGHIGDIYSFQVEKSFLGESEKQIEVLIPKSVTYNGIVDESPFRVTVGWPSHIKPDYNKKYVVFLGKASSPDIFLSAVVPNHIEIQDNGTAELSYNKDTAGKTKNEKGDNVVFSLDYNELTDEITGIKEQLFDEIIREIDKKGTE